MGMNSGILLVIPVFNEANRWNNDYFLRLASEVQGGADFLFVNDGSSDTTQILIEELCSKSGRFNFLVSERNLGKAESVRNGFLFGISKGYQGVGFLDADGAFHSVDVVKIVKLFSDKTSSNQEFKAIWSSRISLAGRSIKRSKLRHLFGRLISTLIVGGSGFMPWDTQSGLKIFMVDHNFVTIISERFRTRWFFEVELIQRHKKVFSINLNVWEEPLDYWSDIKGSKINLKQYFFIFAEVLFIVMKNFELLVLRKRTN